MSLINDALKRAKQAQQQPVAAAPSALQFRPVETPQTPRRGPALGLPFGLAALALLALLCAFAFLRRSPQPSVVAAKEPVSHRENSAPPAPAPPAAVTVVTPNRVKAPAAKSEPPASSTAAPVASSAQTGSHPAGLETTSAQPPITELIAPPAPLPFLKLEAIIFNPRRPSAIISGRTFFLGDKFGDLRIVAISQNTATLIGAGRTNVLSLPE
jgi:hypothetical protein